MPKCALVGGEPLRKKPFPQWPVWGKRERELLLAVLKSGAWGGYPYPAPLYRQAGAFFARLHDAKFGLPAANGTVTLEVALQAVGVKPYDEVILPPLTFVATAAAVLKVGAIPCFADVEERNWCLDPKAVEEKITPRTRAMIPVHLGMCAADLDALKKIARRHRLAIVEDCAHAHGGKWRGKGLGSFGDVGSFSFQSSKLLTAGEGGMLITNSHRVRERIESIINCGRPSSTDRYRERPFGYNYRITEFQAALMMAQLERLEAQTRKREENIEILERLLRGFHGVKLLPKDSRQTRRHAYHVLLRFQKEAWEGISRDLFVAALTAEGIPADGLFYEPLYDSPLFQVKREDFPQLKKVGTPFLKSRCKVAERACYEESIWLHHSLFLGGEREVRDIARALEKLYAHREELFGLRGKVEAKSRALRRG